MQIRGMKYLKKNDYDSLVISQGKINVYGNSKWPSMRLSHSIADELKLIDTDSEKESRVVEYFLDYNKICAITDNYSQGGRDYLYIGGNNRSLKFGHQPRADVINSILSHYRHDRLEFLYNEKNSYEITISDGTSSYDIDEKGKVRLNICTKKGQIINLEKTFFRRIYA